jgi:hypothetical protein
MLLGVCFRRTGANVGFSSPYLSFFAVTASPPCSTSSQLCLAVICTTADVHDVYELMREFSLNKVQNQTLILPTCSVTYGDLTGILNQLLVPTSLHHPGPLLKITRLGKQIR